MKIYEQIEGNHFDKKKFAKVKLGISKEKILLMQTVHDTEKYVLRDIAKNDTAVYLNIPFCPSKCSYCSFMSYSRGKFKRYYRKYIEMLHSEIETRLPEIKDSVVCLYIGGGTPLTLEQKDFADLFDKIYSYVPRSQIRECTVEAGRPELFAKEYIAMLKDYGMNRIALNPQTLNDKTLARIGRMHTADDFHRAYEIISDLGISVINSDLIIGLPGESQKDVLYTLHRIFKCEAINNITLHTLAPKRAASKQYTHSKGIKKMYNSVYQSLMHEGFSPYYLYKQRHIADNLENTGFCKGETASLYNMIMINEKHTVYGFGAGASSKYVHGSSVSTILNYKDLALYISEFDAMLKKHKNRRPEVAYDTDCTL